MELVPILKNGMKYNLNYFVKDDYFRMVRLFTAINERKIYMRSMQLKVEKK